MRKEGIKPSKFTFSSILKACSALDASEYGKQIHAQILESDLQSDEFIGSALFDLYSLYGCIEDGLRSWGLFSELLVSGRKLDEFTMSGALSACANLAASRSGELIQGHAVKTGLGCFVIVGTSLICMYAKSGDIDVA
ncbi:hypothetical protein IFM89_012062 [Coptis chinensis]|uniref:Pentatricopeptide repeat-containing protein n=1 Tax=Coptis chinensis TaxID=261450 RepID=A0A835I1I6_9MAGN|nr:hypothetical protein IFM89_012062 [Coptis chinensis]